MGINVNEWLSRAIEEVSELNLGEVFSLKDLFKGYEWKRLSQGDRRTLGTLFLNFAVENPQIEVQETHGQKEYRIIG